jgi:hypothetical protein
MSQVMQQPKQVFYSDDNFSLQYEPWGENVLVHFYINKVSHSEMRKWYKQAVAFEQFAKIQGYSKIVTVSPNPRFVSLFGGTEIKTIEYDNKEYKVTIWDLKQQH